MTITYEFGNSLYVNITNRCTNDCEFCVRNENTNVNGTDNLWLDKEPTVDEIKADFLKRDLTKYDEVVFCGFGEPLIRCDDVLAVCTWLKDKYCNSKDGISPVKIRINTNGHANMIAGHDVTPLMQGIVDVLSISLNAKNAKEYDVVCQSVYGEEAFEGLLDFAKKAKKYVPAVILSVVDVLPKEDIEKCAEIAKSYGVSFKIRKLI